MVMLVAIVAVTSVVACNTSIVVIIPVVSAAVTIDFATVDFILADALAMTSVPLLLSKQNSPDAICSHVVRNIFSICSFYHTQSASEFLHGHGVKVRKHLDCHPNLPRLLQDHTQDLLHHTAIL
jgi:hypothetical protein